ncbi:head-tail connector protein [Methylobacterium sp. CM6246]
MTPEQKLDVVSLDTLKAHARIRHDDEDRLLLGYIAAAFDFLHGPDGWLNGYCLLEEEFELFLDQVGDATELPLRPIPDDMAPTLERRLDRGAYTAFEPGDFMLALMNGNGVIARLSAPAFRSQGDMADPRRYRVTFKAGWPEPDLVPASLKQSILLLAAHFYTNREVTAGTVPREIEYGLRSLAGRYRVSPNHS